MSLVNLLSKNITVFKEFQAFLFHKVGKNQNTYKAFGNYPPDLQIPYFFSFLENKGTPILEALVFYNTYLTDASYIDLAIFTIRAEFRRMELKKTTNYIPF